MLLTDCNFYGQYGVSPSVMTVLAPTPLVVWVCDATSSLIFTCKNERTCVRPYIFIILDHVFGRCLRRCDAGCTNKNL